MSSILTNTSAMVALQTLKGINKNLADVQGQISTGKMVANAKDNAAVWAISKTMESDVQGFKAISSSLSLGESTVSVARQASETVSDLLTQMKQKIVASQEENVDRAKIQTDIAALRDQIGSVVGAAQFNGLNLLSNADTTQDSGTVNVLSSLDRSASGVEASDIAVGKQDLGTDGNTIGSTGLDGGGGAAVNDGATGEALTITALTDMTDIAGANFELAAAGGLGFSAAVDYVARDGDTLASITSEMVERLNVQAVADGIDVTFEESATTAGQIDMVNNSGAAITVAAGNFTQSAVDGSENDGTIGGGLELLADIDVTTDSGAEAALSAIEGLISKSIDSAAAFGSAQGRIETQADFISGLTDALKAGIGTLVDADMEEASARLQALQVQQQLGVQSLSIANQAPQTLLSLFR